jgi:hypothetical protein
VTDLVELNSGSHKNITTVLFDQIRLLSNSWGDVNSSFGSISIVAAVRAGCTGGSNPNHVPNTTATIADVSVSRDPLLLTSRSPGSRHLHISHKSTGSISCSGVRGIVLVNLKITINLDSS